MGQKAGKSVFKLNVGDDSFKIREMEEVSPSRTVKVDPAQICNEIFFNQ